MALAPDQLRLIAEEHPDALAYRVTAPTGGAPGTMTFREWDGVASRVARGLMARGVAPGDRVAVMLTGGQALRRFQAHVGAHKAGAVHLPVDPDLSDEELVRLLGHAEPRVLVADAGRLDRARRVRDRIDSLELVVAAGGDAPSHGREVAWDDLLDDDASDVQADIDADAPSDIIYTSGTTGRPKGVLARHGNVLQLPVTRPTWNGMGWFHASPLFTVAALAFTYVPMQLGMTGVYQPRFTAATFLDLVEDGTVNMAFLVPAMVELLLREPGLDDRDLSGLNLVTVGAAPIRAERLQELDARLPAGTVLNAFALTESGSAQVVLPADEVARRPGSVGRPLPPSEAKVVDESGDEVPRGEMGEILLRTPGGGREYFRDPEATERTWRKGWLHTGDLGHMDEDGFLYVRGRAKDVIIRGGHNVHAGDVEEVLESHPGVREAAVFGVEHDVLGEDVAAIVVAADTEVDVVELTRWCEERLARHKVPRQLHVRDSLPRNAAGKVLKHELRQDLEDQVPR